MRGFKIEFLLVSLNSYVRAMSGKGKILNSMNRSDDAMIIRLPHY